MNAITPNPSALPSTSDQQPKQDGEMSIIDMLFIVTGHYRMVLAVAFLGLLAGLAIALLVPKSYNVVTIIEIGSTEQNGIGQTALEPPDAVIAKLTNAYLPPIEVTHGQVMDKPNFTFAVDIKNPKNTKLIVMTSKAALADESEHALLHTKLADKLLVDHHDKLKFIRLSLDAELANAQRTLISIREQGDALVLQKALLEQSRKLTSEQLADIEVQTKRIEDNRAIAGQRVSDKDQVLTLMMLDLQVARERDKRDELQKRLTVDFVAEAERLIRVDADNKRQLQAQESAISQIKSRGEALADTKVINPPQRSQRAVGVGRSVQVLGGLLVGLLMGVIGAFFLESLQTRRVRLSQQINP